MLNRPTIPLSTFAPGTLCYCQNITYGSEMHTKDGRPAIILGNENYNRDSFKVPVVLLSHTCTSSDIHICVDDSLGKKFLGSYIHIEEVATVDKRRLSDFQCVVSDDLMGRILTALSKFHEMCNKCGLHGNGVSIFDHNSEIAKLNNKIKELEATNEAIKEKYEKLQRTFKSTVEMM